MMNTTAYPGRVEWLVERIKKNPEGLLLVAAGCALLLRAGSRNRFNDSVTQAGSLPSQAASRAAEYVQSATEKASDYASQAASYATSTAESFKSDSERVVGSMRTQVSDTVERVTQRQPLAIAAVGLLAGAAIATAFPPTDIERRTMGPLADDLKEAGSDLADRLSEGTQAASGRLKQAANERGLNAEGLKETGAEVAKAFTGSLSDQPAKRSAYENTPSATPIKPSH
jgi:hypothetical protein